VIAPLQLSSRTRQPSCLSCGVQTVKEDPPWIGNRKPVVAMSLPPSGTLAASDRTILSGVDTGCGPFAVTATGVRVSRRKERVAALMVPSFLTAGLF
jgi:hypothetical protein